jgi:hypothetical protein
MKDKNFIEAFSRVTFDDSVSESLMSRFRDGGGRPSEREQARSGRRGGLRPASVFVVALVAVLAFGGIAYASGMFSGGQFVRSLIAPADTLSEDQSDKQDQFLLDASTDIGETVTHGNVAITLDEVTADDFAVFTKLTIRSVDGKPLYDGQPDGVGIMGDIEFPDADGKLPEIGDEWPEIIPQRTVRSSVQPAQRIDDGSDPALIELAIQQNVDGDGRLSSFTKARVGFFHPAAYFGETEHKISDDVFVFKFDVNPVAARTFTTEIKGSPVEVRLSPFSISYRYNTRGEVFSTNQYQGKGSLDYYELYLSPVDRDGKRYELGSGGGFKYDMSEDDGYVTATFALRSGAMTPQGPQGAMIDVDSIVGVCEADYLASDPDGTVYPLREE